MDNIKTPGPESMRGSRNIVTKDPNLKNPTADTAPGLDTIPPSQSYRDPPAPADEQNDYQFAGPGMCSCSQKSNLKPTCKPEGPLVEESSQRQPRYAVQVPCPPTVRGNSKPDASGPSLQRASSTSSLSPGPTPSW
eukprot:2653770-Rhodomonas_salina.1